VLDNNTLEMGHKAFTLPAGLIEEERRIYSFIQFPETST
jgi:hypothetical protein